MNATEKAIREREKRSRAAAAKRGKLDEALDEDAEAEAVDKGAPKAKKS